MSIYDQSELLLGGGQAGDISGVSWFKTNTESYLTPNAFFQVYLKHTSTTEFLTAADYNNEVVGATLVYENTAQTIPANIGWFDIPFSTPFTWNGTDNIMVLTRWMRIGNATGAINWEATAPGVAKVSHSFNSTSAMGALYTNPNRPNLKLEFGAPTSINESVYNLSITVYPNPSNGLLILEKPKTQGMMSILDHTGRIVLRKQLGIEEKHTISIAHLANGIYTLVFQTGDRVISKKLAVLR
jgi:hypothetical protein